MRTFVLSVLAILLASFACAARSASADEAQPAPPVDSAESLAVQLVSQMTLAEKLPQLLNVAPAIPRLGVPRYNWWTESLHGALASVPTTNFPEPIGLAASFDAPLLHQVAASIGEELRQLHALAGRTGHYGRIGSGLDTWSPNINIFRDPRWGRGQETYGEDPYLTARLAVAFVEGMQGPDPNRPVIIATPKHFAVHSGPEPMRHTIDVNVSPHDLEDTYLPAFRAAIVEAHAGSIMCAYNSVDGQPACANRLLLDDLLVHDWGFKGYVVSDCDALLDISETHHFTPDGASAVAAALARGVANECNTSTLSDLDTPVQRYSAALARGLLSTGDIDRALVKLFAARFRTGDLPGLPGARSDAQTVEPILAPQHVALALRSAQESMVLLKNDGLLPLAHDARLLVVGPLADATRVLRGNYSSAQSGDPVSVLAALRQALPQARITYLPAAPSMTDGDPVPVSALRSENGEPGLSTEYFNPRGPVPERFATADERARFESTLAYEDVPALARVEPGVNARAQGLARVQEFYRVAWSGFLVPADSGTYRIALSATNGTLVLAGKELAKWDHVPYGTRPSFQTVELQAGVRYPIRIDAAGSPSLDIQLLWKRVADSTTVDLRSAADAADAIVAVVGLTSDLEGEESKLQLPGFAGGDRTTLDLPADQQHLLAEARATGKPLIVVLMNGGALNLEWAKQNATAILEAWYPGQAGGVAIASVLSGAANPAGRLPLTFYRDAASLPPFDDYSMHNRTYRYFAGRAVYPFGYGLSFTAFGYRHLTIEPTTNPSRSGLRVSVRVRNVGKLAGDEVTQLYLRFPRTPGAPRIALRGFQRLTLLPGEERTLDFALSPRDLSCVDLQGIRRVVAGRYQIVVGSGQPNTGVPTAAVNFTTAASSPLPR